MARDGDRTSTEPVPRATAAGPSPGYRQQAAGLRGEPGDGRRGLVGDRACAEGVGEVVTQTVPGTASPPSTLAGPAGRRVRAQSALAAARRRTAPTAPIRTPRAAPGSEDAVSTGVVPQSFSLRVDAAPSRATAASSAPLVEVAAPLDALEHGGHREPRRLDVVDLVPLERRRDRRARMRPDRVDRRDRLPLAVLVRVDQDATPPRLRPLRRRELRPRCRDRA